MSQIILKLELELKAKQHIKVPGFMRGLHAKIHGQTLLLWVQVRNDVLKTAFQQAVTLHVLTEGDIVPDDAEHVCSPPDGDIMFHVYVEL